MGKCAVPYPRGVRRPKYCQPITDGRSLRQPPMSLYMWSNTIREEFAKRYCDAIGSTIRVLSLAPDDIVVVQYPDKLSDRAIERLSESVGRYFPNKIMVLEEGMTIGVVTAKEKAEVDG